MLEVCWYILRESAIYILVGFAIAAALHAWVSESWALRWLSRRGTGSVFLATVFGLPLPLCSCSVLPAALTLRRKGASKGATLSFLISTPETSVTSILLTYSLLGPVMAIVRPIAACITALLAGLVENVVDRSDAPQTEEAADGGGQSCCCHTEPAAEQTAEPRTIKDGLRYAFVNLFDDIFIWIAVGIAVAAIIQVLLPESVFRTVFGGTYTSMLLMLVVGVPLYICAEGSTPIAAALLLQGVNPGAALVLLLVGPATNIGAVGILYRELGRRTVIVYLVTIAVIALVMGALLNLLIAKVGLPPIGHEAGEPLVPGVVKTLGAAAFLVLGLFSIRRRRYWSRLIAWLDTKLPVRFTQQRALGLVIVIAVLAYVGSGFFTVQPGEIGIVKCFGAITRSDLKPGLHYAWPYPIGAADRVLVSRIYRMELGADPVESWLLVGDENIADIKISVHYAARPDEVIRFQYGVEDRERLVRSVTLGAVREVLGGSSINSVLTTNRREREIDVTRQIQKRLDEYNVGIRVDSFHFLDAHAPPDVHPAFRDVASALEDKSAKIDRARTQEARVIPLARGQAEQALAEADGYAASTVLLSQGESQRFLDLLAVQRRWPLLTEQRLYFETLSTILPGRQKYIKATGENAGELDIWLVSPDVQGGMPWPPGARK